MFKKNRIIISAILVLVLMASMATTALADFQSAYLKISDTTAKYSNTLQSDVSFATGWNRSSSYNNMNLWLERRRNGNWSIMESTNVPISGQRSTSKYRGQLTDLYRVRIYPNTGSGVDGQGNVYDF